MPVAPSLLWEPWLWLRGHPSWLWLQWTIHPLAGSVKGPAPSAACIPWQAPRVCGPRRRELPWASLLLLRRRALRPLCCG